MSAFGNLFGDGESDSEGEEQCLTVEELDTWARVTVTVGDETTDEPEQPDGGAADNAAEPHPLATYQLVQASAAFSGTGEDETGSVLWGAALHLSRLLHTRRNEWLQPMSGCTTTSVEPQAQTANLLSACFMFLGIDGTTLA